MATITLKGKPIHSCGELPRVGDKLPAFKLTKGDLSDVDPADFPGKVLILNIVPSLDTGVCAASARAFNTRIKQLGGALVLTISRDLPFAQKRFCEAEGIDAVIPLSQLRDAKFGRDYGIELVDGPLTSLLGRAVIVADASGRIVYTQLVPEIGQEPDYESALAAAKAAAAAAGY
ncbi:MAG: lipid hydroperoxide peroxidase [Spirochaetes bacterium GWD1_61_31]|nr:MAG: lipid hydroperoxide peroxidase [Spirochaetes bacterium GWB1_60_80]OHD30454.1 MAG: lipid hydroperoxide peroxidase [Spirochaetes bacterium GWC1_61_12]OHD41296.1 MAG: lipid hydroperoxide peroxidase [Spirochaetes bacterium GWD1_61_31]OHD44406.1 MAG: lipid hydroperoxide peroxidase [Spirochaetes bacterium GWE1_60_18]OHD60860.1 MAG: lipid hydroperoxide peroxidase [Spirochaetes bacterium GWF1_60_12]HAP43822.1 thiol peroxidase [Spirochaetaceae bacterium]